MKRIASCEKGERAKRIASDWQAYTEEEFHEHGMDWEGATKVVISETPPGLIIRRTDLARVQKAFNRVSEALQFHNGTLEIGWTFDGNAVKAAEPVADYPEVLQLVQNVTTEFGYSMVNKRLNVSCLRYVKGSKIGTHRDRDIYDENIFGCILKNTSDRCLEFLEYTGDDVQRYVLKEEPGICFLQNKEARHVWYHGIPHLNRGERISITWRWFKERLSEWAT